MARVLPGRPGPSCAVVPLAGRAEERALAPTGPTDDLRGIMAATSVEV